LRFFGAILSDVQKPDHCWQAEPLQPERSQDYTVVRKRIRLRCGNSAPAAVETGSESAVAREMTPRIPAHDEQTFGVRV
jgi:hypothetical protein